MDSRKIVLYLTHGIAGGDPRREELCNLVVQTFPSEVLECSRWKNLPPGSSSTTQVVGVSDTCEDSRTLKLLKRKVPVFTSEWLVNCIARKAIVTPLDAWKVHQHLNNIGHQPYSKLLKVFSCSNGWTAAEDDVIRAIQEFRNRGDLEKASRFESILLKRNRTRANIDERISHLFGQD